MVYLARSVKEPHTEVALKVLKKKYMKNDELIYFVKQEMQIHSMLSHQNIVRMLDKGENGKIKKPNGSEVDDLYYIVLEYVP
jgi:serine/threonine protein kinase